MKSCIKKCLITLFVLLFSLCAKADVVVWPAYCIIGGMFNIYAIILCLFVKFIFVKYFTKTNWKKAILTTMSMILLSYSLGVGLIVAFGISVDSLIPGYPMNLAHWVISYLAVIIINTLLESLIVKLMLKLEYKKIIPWLLIANIISIIVCAFFSKIMILN